MQRRHRHVRVRRLLTCASAALVLAAVYTNAAEAGLDGITGQSDPLATTVANATTAVGDVTNTVTGTVESTTAATGPAGDVVSSTLETATGTVSDPTQTVSNTVNQTVATAGATVDAVGAAPSSGVEPTVQAMSPAVSAQPSPTTPTLPGTEAAATDPAAASGEPAASEPSQVTVTFTRVESGRATPTRVPRRTPPPRPHSSGAAAAGAEPTPAAAVRQRAADRERPSLLRSPRAPLPGAPSSIASLLGGSSSSGSFVLAALLAALLVSAFGRHGGRLRPLAGIFRPPDVLFQLERPG